MSIKVTWYSHACFLIETDKAKLLVDPFITGNPLAPVKADDVEADYILVSHGHGDNKRVHQESGLARFYQKTGVAVPCDFD